MRADLHTHTSASDGTLNPSDLIKKAQNIGLDVIAITDHDTVDGIHSALTTAVSSRIRVIPGVEISTDIKDNEVHILGFFIDYTNVEFGKKLLKLRLSRQERAEKMVVKLAQLGMAVNYQRVLEIAGQGASVGRPHVAQALLEKGYVDTFREAFEKYLGRNCPAYVDRLKMTPEEAVELIRDTKGLPVLAHPADIGDIDQMVSRLIQCGLVGVEVYYQDYNVEIIKRLRKITKKYKLVATGGSDFHGETISAGAPLGSVDVPEEAVYQLIDLAKQKGRIQT
ncbi:MAG: PHP domain-containing protein [Chloroflexi bacterium]|nr:PHP domain-containing protein [Chloroflexota bacterium]